MISLKELTRVTSYPWYGAGGHQSLGAPPYVFTIQGFDLVNSAGKWVSTIRALHNFNLRLFVDSWSIVPEKTSVNQNFTIKLDPTEQNFFYDDFLRLLHANGRNAIICPSGLFDWLVVPGYSQRKSACYDHSMSPSNPAAWKDFAHLFKLLTEYFRSKPYKVKLQGGNELDFRWNVMHELTREEIAVGQWEIVKAIFDTNPEQEIMLGCTLNPTMETYNGITDTMDGLAAAEGRVVPWHKITWSDNHYVRDQGGNQGGGLADTPESQWEQTFVYRTQLNARCKQRGMKFEITEMGYSNSTSTSFAALKQKAPTLQGVSHNVAPGVLWFRSMLMYGSFSECTGVSRYHCKNGFESEPFTFIGVNHDDDFDIGKEDWSSKECKIYYEQQMELYGHLPVVNYRRVNSIYYATLADGRILHYSDKVNVGTVTPMPTLTNIIPPVEPEPPNPPTMRKAFITMTTSVTGISENITEGLNLVPAKYAIYVDGEAPVTLELFKDGVSFIAKRTENGKPLAVGGDDNGVLRLKDFPAGTYKLVMNAEAINFTVGATPPPVQDVKGTTFVKKADGSIAFNFEDNTQVIINP